MQTSSDNNPPVFFSAAFRPFFMFAGLYGMAPMVFWLMVSSGEGYVPGPLPPIYWHGHEMLFGFAIAAVCGFMLTAVPNWTRTPPVAGPVLMVLAGLWLAGRIAFWVGWDLGAMPVAVIDLMLIPALGIVAGGRIISAGLQRNFVFIGLLTVLFASNLLMHLQAIGVTTDTAEMGLRLGIYGFVLLVTLIAGRIVPNFTSGALRMDAVPAEASTPPAIEKLVVLTLLAAIVADLAGDAVPQMVTAAMQLLASASLLVRMRNWQTLKTLGQPIVWVLHLGHLWLVVGFALLGLSGIIGHPGEGAALHALTAGAIGTMILAVMTRAALGHSGRQLHASKPIVVAYVLVSIGALLRVLTPYLGFQAVIVGGVLWTLAFVIFTIAFWPILTRPRT